MVEMSKELEEYAKEYRDDMVRSAVRYLKVRI